MSKELKVGLIAFVSLACFFVFIIMLGSLTFNSGRIYRATFNKLDGLSVGSKIKIAEGINVGEVDELKSYNNKALVLMKITNPELFLTDKTIVKINAESLLGGKYIQLENLDSGTKIKEEDIIVGKDPISLSSVFGTLGDTLGGIDSAKGEGEGPITKVIKFVDNANHFINSVDSLVVDNRTKLDNIISNIDVASSQLSRVLNKVESFVNVGDDLMTDGKNFINNDAKGAVKDVQKLMKSVKHEVDILSGEARGIATDVRRGLYDVMEGPDGVMNLTKNANYIIKKGGKDITSLVTSVNSNLSSLDSFINNLESVVGVFQKDMSNEGSTYSVLLRDEDIAKELKETVKNLKVITEDIRNIFGNSEKPKAGIGPFDKIGN